MAAPAAHVAPERVKEGDRTQEPERSVLENVDKAMGATGLSGAMYLDDDHHRKP
jgi:hypothetical protein